MNFFAQLLLFISSLGGVGAGLSVAKSKLDEADAKPWEWWQWLLVIVAFCSGVILIYWLFKKIASL